MGWVRALFKRSFCGGRRGENPLAYALEIIINNNNNNILSCVRAAVARTVIIPCSSIPLLLLFTINHNRLMCTGRWVGGWTGGWVACAKYIAEA